jgi:hypothetical protein
VKSSSSLDVSIALVSCGILSNNISMVKKKAFNEKARRGAANPKSKNRSPKKKTRGVLHEDEKGAGGRRERSAQMERTHVRCYEVQALLDHSEVPNRRSKFILRVGSWIRRNKFRAPCTQSLLDAFGEAEIEERDRSG